MQQSHIAVVLASGYSTVLAQGRGAGVRVLQKPYTLKALASVLGELSPTPMPV